MQYFRNTADGSLWAFEDTDDLRQDENGVWRLYMPDGSPNPNIPDTLEPTDDITPPGPTDEQLAASVRGTRTAYLAATDWLTLRHRDQVEQGVTSNLTAAQFTELLTYRQALRDVPQQPGFPHNDLPQKPTFIPEA